MTLLEAVTALQAVPAAAAADVHIAISSCYAGDLMSDVLTWADTGALLLTTLATDQVARVAAMRHCAAVVLVQGKAASDELIEAAQEEGIALYRTDLSLFAACGRIACLFEAASA